MIAFIPNKGEYLGVQDEPDRQEQDDTDQKGVRFAGSGQGTNTMIDPGTPRGAATPQTIVDRGRKEQSESPRSRLPQARAESVRHSHKKKPDGRVAADIGGIVLTLGASLRSVAQHQCQQETQQHT